MATLSAKAVPLNQAEWEIWVFAGTVRMPVRECGAYRGEFAEDAAVEMASRLRAYLRDGETPEGLFEACDGADDRADLLALPAFLRSVGADPARCVVSAARPPRGTRGGDNQMAPPWVTDPDDDDADDVDTTLAPPEVVYLPSFDELEGD